MLAAMFSLPGLVMFILGVLLSGWVMTLVGRARTSVSG